MKTTFPNYKIVGMDTIKLKPKDQEVLKSFMKFCEGSAGEHKCRNIERMLKQIYDVSGVSFDKWDLEVSRDFLAILNKSKRSNSNTNDLKKTLKRFLKENYEDWNKRFKGFKDPSWKQKDEVNYEKLNVTTMLKPNEFEMLVKKAENFRWRAYISLSYESAGRPEEILKTKWSDLDLEGRNLKLHSSKTGNVRRVFLEKCIIHIKQYKENYPYPDVKASDYIFPSPRDRNKHLSLQAVHSYLQTLGKNVLGKAVFPYLFRHTRLSFLMGKLSGKAYVKFADHSIATAIKNYSHIGDKGLKEEMFSKVFDIKELTLEEKEDISQLKEQMTYLQNKIQNLELIVPLEVIKKLEGNEKEKFIKEYIRMKKHLDEKYKKLKPVKDLSSKQKKEIEDYVFN